MKNECLPIDPMIKIVPIITSTGISGDWGSNTYKEITVPITIPSGYTAIGLQGWDYTITAGGVTGFKEWLALGKYWFSNNNSITFGYTNVMTGTISSLTSFNPSMTIICIKSDNIKS